MTPVHALFVITATLLLGCSPPSPDVSDSAAVAAEDHDPAMHEAHMGGSAGATDSGFAAVQARGARGMGVDQYTSTHTFEPRADGGRITLRRDVDDAAGVEQIRTHMKTIADAFAAGNFTTPDFVHARTVPGTDIMAAKRAAISYRAAPIPYGAELIMTTRDSAAIDAIHRFLAFQRSDHRAGDGSDTARSPKR